MTDNDQKKPKPIYKKVWFWMLSALIVLTTIGLIRGPGSQEINHDQVGDRVPASPNEPQRAAQAASDQPVTCDSEDAAEMVKSALEGSSNAFSEIKVLDFGKAQETYFSPEYKSRGCKAIAELSTGGGLVTYQLHFGPSGKALVQVQTGTDARIQLESDRLQKVEQSGQRPAAVPTGNGNQGAPEPTQNEEQGTPMPSDSNDQQQPASKDAAPKADQ